MLLADKLRLSRHFSKQGARLYLTLIARKVRKLAESLSSGCASRGECVEPYGLIRKLPKTKTFFLIDAAKRPPHEKAEFFRELNPNGSYN